MIKRPKTDETRRETSSKLSLILVVFACEFKITMMRALHVISTVSALVSMLQIKHKAGPGPGLHGFALVFQILNNIQRAPVFGFCDFGLLMQMIRTK